MHRTALLLATLVLSYAGLGCDLKFQETRSLILDEPAKQITRGSTIKSHPTWSPDGTKLAYSSLQRSTELSSFSLQGELPQPLGRFQDEIGSSKFALSPDGSRLVYRSLARGYLWIVDLDIETERLLTAGHKSAQHPAWSSNGQGIAFSALSGAGSWSIWTISAEGGEPMELTDNSSNDFHPSWSPGARQIAFESQEGALRVIKVFDLDSLRASVITSDTLDCREPAWAPDGASIAFSSTSGSDAGVFVVQVDSGDVAPITTNLTFAANPTWSSDGSRIAYQTASGISVSSPEGALLNQTSIQDVHPVWVPNQLALVQKELLESAIIEVIRFPDSTITAVTQFSDRQIDSEPAWFSDSETLAFTRQAEHEDLEKTIWTVRLGSPPPQSLLGESSSVSFASNPAVSPNGHWLVFDNTERLFLLPLASGEPVDLTPFVGFGLTEASWSPESNGIVCRTSNSLRILTADSSLVIEEQRIPGQFSHPTWALPDPVFGTTLAAQAPNGILLISLERSTQEVVVSGGRHPCWSPDGKWLAFIRDNQVFVMPILFSI